MEEGANVRTDCEVTRDMEHITMQPGHKVSNSANTETFGFIELRSRAPHLELELISKEKDVNQNQEFEEYTDHILSSLLQKSSDNKPQVTRSKEDKEKIRQRQPSKVTSEDSYEMIMNFEDNPIELNDIYSKYKPPEMLACVPRKRSYSKEDCKIKANVILSGTVSPMNELL